MHGRFAPKRQYFEARRKVVDHPQIVVPLRLLGAIQQFAKGKCWKCRSDRPPD
jgi:hypothetical protein